MVTAYSQSTRNDSRRADDKIVIANTYVIGNSDQMSQKKKDSKDKTETERRPETRRRINDGNTGSTRATEPIRRLTNLNESISQKKKTISVCITSLS